MPTVTIQVDKQRGGTKEHHFGFAGSWPELTPLLLGRVALQLALDVDEEVKRVHIFKLLTGIPKELAQHIGPEDLIYSWEKRDEAGHRVRDEWRLLPQLDWLFGTAPSFEKSLVPAVDVGGKVWIGPKDQLKNLTVNQWGFIDICLEAYSANPTEEALNNVLGAMYCPPDEAWSRETIEERAAKLAKLPTSLKAAAIFNYRAVHAELPFLFPLTFKKRKEDNANPYGLDGFLVSMAGVKFGKPEEVGEAKLHHALMQCENILQEEARMKAATTDKDTVKLI